MNTFTKASSMQAEDALSYLPHKHIQSLVKDHVIYDARHPSRFLYLVIQGRIMITHTADGCQIVARLVPSTVFLENHASLSPLHQAKPRSVWRAPR